MEKKAPKIRLARSSMKAAGHAATVLAQELAVPDPKAKATPGRIQRSRAKGARLAASNALPIACVSRPSPWGNPFSETLSGATPQQKPALRAAAVAKFRRALLTADPSLGFTIDDVRRELSGKNLACWCPLNEPCHADVLLDVANARRRPKMRSGG